MYNYYDQDDQKKSIAKKTKPVQITSRRSRASQNVTISQTTFVKTMRNNIHNQQQITNRQYK